MVDSWTARGIFTVAFLGATAGVQMSDMGLQAISLSAIQQTFEISDTTVGSLQGLAGVLVGSALAIPLARFADHFSRKRLLLWLIVASTAMMVLSALAPTFPLFFLGRSAAGITEFAMVPLVYSMIPDIAPERHRVAANLSFAGLMAVGASGGFYFAGPLISAASELSPFALEPWRNAFLMLSLAGLPLLLLGQLTTDPPRRTTREDQETEGSLSLFLTRKWKTIAAFVGAAGFLVIGVQAINYLIALALERRFSASPAHIGEVMGVIVLLTTVGCLPFAGLLDRLLAGRLSRAARPGIMAVCTLIATPLVLLMAGAGALQYAFIALGVVLYLSNTANALVPTMIQDLAPATLRARSFAIWSFTVSVFGASGPLVAGLLSDHMFDGDMLNAITLTAVPAMAISVLCAVWLFSLTRRPGTIAGTA